MSNETSQSEAALPARRRIVALPERRVALPIALIAHEGAQRDQLEAQIGSTRPVVTFPSLAHFDAETAGRERWAGIIVARSHAWDARLDACVPRRAFIALYGLTDEGYGWPDTVKRVSGPEELEAWLSAVAAPVLPPDDRPRVVKPRSSKPSVFTMSLAGEPVPVKTQLSLPAVAPVPVKTQLSLPAVEATPAPKEPLVGPRHKKTRNEKPAQTPKPVKAQPKQPAPKSRDRKLTQGAPKQQTLLPVPALGQGLKLSSNDASEQAVIDAVRLLGTASARAIVDALERFDRITTPRR